MRQPSLPYNLLKFALQIYGRRPAELNSTEYGVVQSQAQEECVLHARILASVAEFENEVRSERIRAGQEAARARGKRWGGRKLGTRVRLTPEKERTALRLYEAGEPITEIAKAVDLSRPTIYRVLEDVQ